MCCVGHLRFLDRMNNPYYEFSHKECEGREEIKLFDTSVLSEQEPEIPEGQEEKKKDSKKPKSKLERRSTRTRKCISYRSAACKNSLYIKSHTVVSFLNHPTASHVNFYI